MKIFQSLTHRYMLFLTVVLATLVAGSLVITSSVVRNGMVDLYRQRLERVGEVLDQYSRVRYYSRVTELEAVLSSPRFSAAVETGDSSTIAREAPFYRTILDTDLLLLTDADRKITAAAGSLPETIQQRLPELFARDVHGIETRYLVEQDDVFEFTVADIVNYEGRLIGYVAAGGPFSAQLADDLGRLTGFDIILAHDNHILGHTQSLLNTELVNDRRLPELLTTGVTDVIQTEFDDQELVYTAVLSPYEGITAVFVGSLDQHVAPIMNESSLYLLLFVAGSGIIALLIVYLFTTRQIGRQVHLLVDAAERIAREDFDFRVIPRSRDELGFLAGEFEKMRSRLVENRTELEQAQEERLQSERLAAVGQLVAGIVHDFKNPMSVIRGTAEMICLKHQGDDKLHRQCTNISDQIDRMLDLTRDILEYSRGRTSLDVTTVGLRDYIAEVYEFHLPSFQSKGVRLVVEAGPDLTITLDPGRFRRVLDNILNNAREALSPGDRVTIVWQVHDNRLDIDLRDNGPGIPEEILDTIFDPFVTRGKQGGTGLGLAIARKIVEDHGATIDLVSAAAHGTTFTIHLPAKLVEHVSSDDTFKETSHV